MSLAVCVLIFGAGIFYFATRYFIHEPKNFSRHFKNFHPVLATHRGYGKHAAIPENTLAAFRAAEKLGFRAHELDVRRTKDCQIMLLHGPRLEETTDGTGRMEDTHSTVVATLDAAHYLEREHPRVRRRYEKVPTLAEALSAIHPDALINVELKRDRWDFSRGLEEQALAIVLNSPARDRVFFSGFHFLTLWRLRRRKCPLPVGLLVEPGFLSRAKIFLYRLLLLPDNIHLHASLDSATYMRRLKKRGFGLAFWTVNDLEKVCRLFAQGADFVITDRMDFLRQLMVKQKENNASRRSRRSLAAKKKRQRAK